MYECILDDDDDDDDDDYTLYSLSVFSLAKNLQLIAEISATYRLVSNYLQED